MGCTGISRPSLRRRKVALPTSETSRRRHQPHSRARAGLQQLKGGGSPVERPALCERHLCSVSEKRLQYGSGRMCVRERRGRDGLSLTKLYTGMVDVKEPSLGLLA